eukprot:comp15034_c0_seq1/m.11654 comp15034_c0_seq1/g.11654  ORF comp15034_c0_seq1/g.11654 comp15034_c0_seq1/m.11654 type:complete len:186 (-) comp15034_c0_seq1:305-862(-)
MLKEYRIPMPLTVDEYKIGQLYMIAKHSHEETRDGEGVEVVVQEPCEDEKHGKGVYTEKRMYLNGKLGPWLRSMVPKIFYVTERAWNYYPYTYTEYECSFVPKFCIRIHTCYLNDNGSAENPLDLSPEQLAKRVLDLIDIADDTQIPKNPHYDVVDLRVFRSKKNKQRTLVGRLDGHGSANHVQL